jgi:glycosyltransferase involved in cell wall biosynthesis
MNLSQVKLLIVDQSLRDLNGHHSEYDLSVARAAKRLSVLPIIATHVQCDAGISCDDAPIRRHFKRGWDEVHQSTLTRIARQILGNLPRPLRAPVVRLGSKARRLVQEADKTSRSRPRLPSFGDELRSLIRIEGLSDRDHVLIHTVGVAELQSFITSCATLNEFPIMHVLLRRDAEEPSVAAEAWGGLRGLFERIRRTPGLMSKIRFYADTADLCDQYGQIGEGIRFELLPIPHELGEALDITETRRPGPVRITYLGNARTEKGFHYLPALVSALKSSYLDTGKVRFIFQANANMSLEEHVISAARRRLGRYAMEHVELLNGPLSMDEFQARLLEADIVLLPYQAHFYRRRSSGILVQALVAGRPVVVPSDTWMARSAPVGAAVSFGGPPDLAKAVARAIDNLSALVTHARAAAPQWRRAHTATALVQHLLR